MRRLNWTDLGMPRANACDGMEVRLDGFAATVMQAQRADYFLLCRDPQCCIGCLPRDPSAAVEVFAAEPLPIDGKTVRLTGRWRVQTTDANGWCYQLHDARPLAPAGRISRRGVLGAAPALYLAACNAADTPAATAGAPAATRPETDTDGRAAIADQVTVDLHSHAGQILGVRRIRENAPFTAVAEPMRQGGMAVTCLAAVADSPATHITSDGRIRPYRTPEPGELYAYSQGGFGRVHRLIERDRMAVITTADQLGNARAAAPAAIVTSEGADFLEGRIERVDEAHQRWKLRQLQLTHYRVNELGDIQTESPVHDGLTEFGAEVIRRCNRLGIVVDVAHGTYELVKRAAAVTAKPLLLSHTSLSALPGPYSRQISADHARIIAGTGGVIGVWPVSAYYPTLAAMARGMARLAEVVGVAHVGLGTDMLGLVGPSTLGDDYRQLPGLATALLGVGFTPAETRQILGGNYQRLFVASLA